MQNANPIAFWYTLDMEKLMVEHYPFKVGEKREVILPAIYEQIHALTLFISKDLARDFKVYVNKYFHESEAMFDYEEQARAKGKSFANLFYHHRDHAIYQTTFDTAAILRAVLSRGGALASHLSRDGMMAALIGAMRHDIGFVTSQDSPNYAARSPIHVEEGMKNVKEVIKEIGLPSFLNQDRVTELAVLGIHNTYFPYQERNRAWMRSKIEAMTPKQRKEAHIVRLAVQFADLGGQVARVDYFPRLLWDLRREINAARPGSGIEVIGQDDQLASKYQGFINFVMEPMIGKVANAFLGKDNTYRQAWIKHLENITAF